jgi:hypothetical protein
MDQTVYMRIDGVMADLLTNTNPDLYRKYAYKENGKTVIYVRLKKALYGTITASLLFWKDLSTTLIVDWGFERNPYDWCVVNKNINGKQFTILWHVDDLKLSHVDPDVVSQVLDKINTRYGKEVPITITRGKVHDYLGMVLDYTEEGRVKITMNQYVEEILDELPSDMDGEAPTPAAAHLFQVDPNAEKLGEEQREMFHRNVAKLLFLSKRARPDIQTAIAFLCTRVKEPDNDDYKKLRRAMRYLRATRHLPLILEDDGSGAVRWWADSAFAVHHDMRSHTGGLFTLGGGAVYSTSVRQKINTKSSTEAELVAVDDVMSQVLWTRNFLEAQGYMVTDNVIHQDNQSAILLEKNGRASSGKRTRHINVRYYFITDRVGKGDVRIEYCPTKDMVADFFTKPLQGAPFRTFRNRVLNLSEDDILRYGRQHEHDLAIVPKLSHRSVLGIEHTNGKKDRQTSKSGPQTLCGLGKNSPDREG